MGKPRGIINIVDATNIERNLYLTMQLMELDVPMVLALNMMDEVRENGGSIRVNEMEAMLGIPVVPISAAKNEGIERAGIDHAAARRQLSGSARAGRISATRKRPQRPPYTAVCTASCSLIEDHAEEAGIPARFAASKLAEGDQLVLDRLNLDRERKGDAGAHHRADGNRSAGWTAPPPLRTCASASFKKVCGRRGRKAAGEPRARKKCGKIDRVLTGKYTAIPAFIGIMGLVFWLTFNVIGSVLIRVCWTWASAR